MIIPQLSWYPGLCVLSGAFGFREAVVTSSTTALVADSSQGKRLGAGMGLRGLLWIWDMREVHFWLECSLRLWAMGVDFDHWSGAVAYCGVFWDNHDRVKNRDLV